MYLTPISLKNVFRFSEPSMMEFYGGLPEFSVRKIRNLEHQHFEMIQVFVWHANTDTELLLVNRITEGEPEGNDILAIFQQDHAGSISQFGAEHLSADRENFAAEFKAAYPQERETPFDVTYHSLEAEEFHGIKDVNDEGPFLSQALYDTQDDDNFPLALIEWERDWLTAWFGLELRKDHISFL